MFSFCFAFGLVESCFGFRGLLLLICCHLMVYHNFFSWKSCFFFDPSFSPRRNGMMTLSSHDWFGELEIGWIDPCLFFFSRDG